MNEDYTNELPPIEGTVSAAEHAEAEEYAEWMAQGCECEIDWKCGVCRENGIRHERMDAYGLGPDADLEALALAGSGYMGGLEY